MILTFGTRFCQCPINVISTSTKILSLPYSIKHLVVSLRKVAFSNDNGGHVGLSFIRVRPINMFGSCKTDWSIKSSANGRGLDPLTGSGDGRTRLLKTVQSLQIRLNARLRDFRKDLPKKLLFFLVGFYCATAFATVIGQTGDWDIMSAAVAVAVVEGIGALMYKASVPLLDRSKNLIVLFNYWKAGLTLGLFLDSFKYETSWEYLLALALSYDFPYSNYSALFSGIKISVWLCFGAASFWKRSMYASFYL